MRAGAADSAEVFPLAVRAPLYSSHQLAIVRSFPTRAHRVWTRRAVSWLFERTFLHVLGRLENNDKTAKRGVVFLNATCMFAARTPVARVAHVPRLMRVTR
jgi:hypothetical protein